MFYIEKTATPCPNTEPHQDADRDLFLIRDLETELVVEATWDAEDADSTCALLNGIDEQARVLAAA